MTIAAARSMLDDVRRISPRIILGLSGGKDSLVTLDLCCKVFGNENVHAYFMRLVDGVRCESAPVDRAVARYPGLCLHVLPHWALSHMLRRSYLRPYVEGCEKLPALKQLDIENEVRRRTGIDWIAYGHRAVESLVRNAMLRKHGMNGNDVKGRRVYPIWDWKNRDVFDYMRIERIPAPPTVGAKYAGQSGGIQLTPQRMHWIFENHPDDYRRIEAVFPFVGTLLARKRIDANAEATRATGEAAKD